MQYVGCQLPFIIDLDQVRRQPGGGNNPVEPRSTEAGSPQKIRRMAALHNPAGDLQALLHHHHAQRHSTVQWDLNPEVGQPAPYCVNRLAFEFEISGRML